MEDRWKSALGRGLLGTGRANAVLGIALGGAMLGMGRIYFLLNHGPAVLDLHTPIDSALPLVPVFVIPYESLMPFVVASFALLLLLRTRIYQSAALSVLLAQAVSFAFYLLLQSKVVRPVLPGTGGLSALIHRVYASDNPFDDFPSLHVAQSVILAIHWSRLGRRAGVVAWVWAALIVASTVLVKQHYVADLAAGALLAFAASRAAERILSRRDAEGLPCAGKGGGARGAPAAAANACA
jgi:membrane-associated phospholipid phosphatase